MTDVATVSVATQSTAAGSSAGATETGTALSSDFETFLRMLTAQVQNQDPLNPLDSTDFAVQLATFSGVEQQVLTNDLLVSLVGALNNNSLDELARWVGMDARAAAPAVFDGTNPILVDTSPVAGTVRAEVRVTDSAGALWDQFEISAQGGAVTWDGTRDDGSLFPTGVYTFTVNSYDANGQLVGSSLGETYNRVLEAQVGPNGPELLLGNGDYVSQEAISALSLPAATN